jgi:hypothetical protein
VSPEIATLLGVLVTQAGSIVVVLVQDRKRKNEAAEIKANAAAIAERLKPVSNGFAGTDIAESLGRVEERIDGHIEHHNDVPQRRKKAA